MGLSLLLILTAFDICTWYILGSLMACIAVCAVADDSPISDETGLAAEGVCSIGILMRV